MARTVAVMPAYNAGRTVAATVGDIPRGIVDEIILVDDCSEDDTVRVARELGVRVLRHARNAGYGANQKTCYRAALADGADFVVMIHPDYQYDARVTGAAVEILRLGICDVVLGSRIRAEASASCPRRPARPGPGRARRRSPGSANRLRRAGSPPVSSTARPGRCAGAG